MLSKHKIIFGLFTALLLQASAVFAEEQNRGFTKVGESSWQEPNGGMIWHDILRDSAERIALYFSPEEAAAACTQFGRDNGIAAELPSAADYDRLTRYFRTRMGRIGSFIPNMCTAETDHHYFWTSTGRRGYQPCLSVSYNEIDSGLREMVHCVSR